MSIVTKNSKNSPSNLDRFRQKRSKRWWWIGFFAVVLGVVIWYLATILIALNRISTPNLTASPSILKDINQGASDQPVNILLIGVGGANHPGGTLADSIMVASVDAKHKSVSLLSVPRDLYVKIPGDGFDKINAVHSRGESNKSKTSNGPSLLKQTVSDTLGVPIHYFIRLDFDGFKKIIDTLGGVTVDVQTALYDPYFPDAKLQGYEPFSIKAGTQKLDGKTALKYVRSRETTSDFDRARRQQEVLTAVKDKALTAQILANPKKVTDLISVVGQHILTDFSPTEIEDFIKLAKSINDPTINRQVLDTGESGLLVSSRSTIGAYIIVPRAGTNDYSQVQLFVQSYLAAPAITEEKATLQLNRTSSVTADVAAKLEKQFELAGFTVTLGDISTDVTKTALYDVTKSKKPYSQKFLTDTYHLKGKSDSITQPTVTTDYLLVVGTDFATVTEQKLVGKAVPTKAPASVNRATDTPIAKSPALNQETSTPSPAPVSEATPSPTPIPTVSPAPTLVPTASPALP